MPGIQSHDIALLLAQQHGAAVGTAQTVGGKPFAPQEHWTDVGNEYRLWDVDHNLMTYGKDSLPPTGVHPAKTGQFKT